MDHIARLGEGSYTPDARLRMARAASDEVGSNGAGNPSARPPVAVVVTHFNPRLGQRVEWQHPRDFVTEGVEFKVQPNPPSAHPLRARVRPRAARMPPIANGRRMRLRRRTTSYRHVLPLTTGDAERLRHL